MNAQHSSQNDSWRTPENIVEASRKVLGGIGFDPASSAEANKIIRADNYMDYLEDSLITSWPIGQSIYLNPPGGKLKGKSLVRLFWRRLMEYRASGSLTHGIFAMFSIGGLQTTQGEDVAAIEFPICIPRKRIRWVDPTGEKRRSPPHSNAFVYVPGSVDKTSLFMSVFSEMVGGCKR